MCMAAVGDSRIAFVKNMDLGRSLVGSFGLQHCACPISLPLFSVSKARYLLHASVHGVDLFAGASCSLVGMDSLTHPALCHLCDFSWRCIVEVQRSPSLPNGSCPNPTSTCAGGGLQKNTYLSVEAGLKKVTKHEYGTASTRALEGVGRSWAWACVPRKRRLVLTGVGAGDWTSYFPKTRTALTQGPTHISW